jgi:ribosome-associated protein
VSKEIDEGPSKTRRKRDAEALQSLGEALAELPGDVLATLDLPDRLLQALEDYSRIPSHEARRRQRQFIGKLMRDVDPAPLQAFLDGRQRPAKEQARLFRLTERWRDRLVAEGEPALAAFLAAHPGATETEELADAVAAAREGRSGAPKRLFRIVRAIIETGGVAGGSPRDDALLE